MVMRWLVPLVALDLMPGVSETLECDASGWLDAEGMNRMFALGETSIVRFDRPPCAVCAELDPLFEIMRTHFPGRVWRVDCAAAPDLCAPVDGDLRGPEIRAWTGEAFAAYGGERSAEALVAWAKLVLAPPPKTENFAATDFDPRGDDDAAATLALEPGRLQAWPGRPLPTRVFVPRTKAGKRPILVYLHGTPQPGDRFDDPGGEGSIREKGFLSKLATNATFAAKFPFVAIVPCSSCCRCLTSRYRRDRRDESAPSRGP